MTKKQYYAKNHSDCPCCGWQGHVKRNTRKWLAFKRNKLAQGTWADT